MDGGTACEILQSALSHHNEWEGHNIMLSVNQSPDPDELADVDLAQCLLDKANGACLRHDNLDNKVRVILCLDLTACSTLTFRHSDISMLRNFETWNFWISHDG
jgi:hypothetical protein